MGRPQFLLLKPVGPNVFGVQSYSRLIELVWYMETYTHFIAGSGVVSVTKHTD